MPKKLKVKLRLDQDGYVYADGFRICKVAGPGVLEFCDKNSARSRARGSRLIMVTLAELVEISVQSDPPPLTPNQ